MLSNKNADRPRIFSAMTSKRTLASENVVISVNTSPENTEVVNNITSQARGRSLSAK